MIYDYENIVPIILLTHHSVADSIRCNYLTGECPITCESYSDNVYIFGCCGKVVNYTVISEYYERLRNPNICMFCRQSFAAISYKVTNSNMKQIFPLIKKIYIWGDDKHACDLITSDCAFQYTSDMIMCNTYTANHIRGRINGQSKKILLYICDSIFRVSSND